MKFGQDTLGVQRVLTVGDKSFRYYSFQAARDAGLGDFSRLPYSLKILLENLLRFEDGNTVTVEDIQSMPRWLENRRSDREIAFRPTRVLMQDFTGVPAVVDLATMREETARLGGDPRKINPLTPVDLVIDHSVMVDSYGTQKAFESNVAREFERNMERYAFLRWGQQAFNKFRVVPPGTGICHQVNIEYLAKVVWEEDVDGLSTVFPDTVVGTDSHTTMVNGLGVLGWGVGGIEAEAAMLGQAISMTIPEVIGFRLEGRLPEGTTATDLVLTITQMLRQRGVVGKFVEFFGPGLDALTIAERCTISNMAPEYGATCGIFPVDRETLTYLSFTGRSPELITMVESYAKEQGMWRNDQAEPFFTDILELRLEDVYPCLAGPKRPQDRIRLDRAGESFVKDLKETFQVSESVGQNADRLTHGDVVIAAITSCTNTSNPAVLIQAALLARKARERNLMTKSWVKTSFAPGSQVVTDYLEQSGLQEDLDALGFHLVGYGCTTCIGNSGPLPEAIAEAIEKDNLVVCAVLSGNRNFEGRVNPYTRANYLASPPLCVAYALSGTMTINFYTDPIGVDAQGTEVYLRDIWPSSQEISETIAKALSPEMFSDRYGDVFTGPEQWRTLKTSSGLTYEWDEESTYVKLAPLFDDQKIEDIQEARILALLGDSVTTDHISPAGSISPKSPAGIYLNQNNIERRDFNSYGARRGNHEVMIRGTFANIRIRNGLLDGIEGGMTKHFPSGDILSIYDAAMRYRQEKVPLIVVAGKEYGSGSSRDWAAKGTKMLGVQAVIAESFERIHRSNLIGMGVLPLQLEQGMTRFDLKISGMETFSLTGLKTLTPRQECVLEIRRPDGTCDRVPLLCRIDTQDELAYYNHGGILPYVLRTILDQEAA